jgi:hypothetical protein
MRYVNLARLLDTQGNQGIAYAIRRGIAEWTARFHLHYRAWRQPQIIQAPSLSTLVVNCNNAYMRPKWCICKCVYCGVHQYFPRQKLIFSLA